jgi:transporter family-2 protein
VRPRTAAALSVAGGALLSVQARVNGALATRLDSAVVAAAVSFSVGTVALFAVVAKNGALERLRDVLPVSAAERRAHRAQRWWHLLGGLGGAFLVSVSAAAVPVIGVAMLSVCVVAGQSSGGLAVDRLGLSPFGRQRLTRERVGGALLAIVAVGIAATTRTGTARPLLLAAAALAGFGVAGQQAANGHLRMHTGRAPVAALVSFGVGTAGLLLVVGGQAVVGTLPALHWPAAPWLYAGGFGGAAYITLAAAAVPVLGVLRLTLASVAGQVIGSVLLDIVTPTGHGLAARTVIGAAILLGAVALASRTPQRAAADRTAAR